MIPIPRPAVPFDACRWCGASFEQKGLAPPARNCCPEQRAEQAVRDQQNERIARVMVQSAPGIFDGMRESLEVAKAIRDDQIAYLKRPSPDWRAKAAEALRGRPPVPIVGPSPIVEALACADDTRSPDNPVRNVVQQVLADRRAHAGGPRLIPT